MFQEQIFVFLLQFGKYCNIMSKSKKGKVFKIDALEIRKSNNDDDYKVFEDIKHIDENSFKYTGCRVRS